MSRMIPIKNLYFILCYVWDMLPDSLLTDRELEDCPRIEDLYGKILSAGVSRLLKRGLYRSYVEQTEPIYGIRGKLNLSASIKNGKLPLGYTVCTTEDYTPDVVENRLLKAAMRLLLQSESIDSAVRCELEEVWLRLKDIDETKAHIMDFRKIQLHGNTTDYRFLLEIAYLVFIDGLINETSGYSQFYDVRDNEIRMGELFEKFIFNYASKNFSDLAVSRPHIKWHNVVANQIDQQYLPVMRSDLVIRSPFPHPQAIVVDMKYYAKLFNSRFSTDKLISGNLYQIFTYLSNAQKEDKETAWQGMLLYPVVDQTVSLDFELDYMPVHIRTINLDQDWGEIEKDIDAVLLSVFEMASDRDPVKA
jgi:5-methylcytosine-specific restriction enzyme subunit McrC